MAKNDFLTDADFEDSGPLKPVQTSVLGRLGDLGLSAVKSAISVPEAAVGLGNLVTGGKTGKAVEAAEVRFKDAKQILDDQKSVAAQLAQRKFERAEGFTGKLAAGVQNPSLIANTVVESVAPMLAGGLVGRGLMGIGGSRVAGAAGGVGPAMPGAMTRAFGDKAAYVAGGVGEGAVMGGAAAEQIRQQTEDGELTGKQAALAGATGALGGAIGVGGAALARRLGVGDIDTAIVTGNRNIAGVAGQKAPGAISRTARGATSEGLFEELPQSVMEQALQNEALGRDWTEDLDAAAAMGILAGGAMGGGMGLVTGRNPVAPPPGTQPPTTTATPGTPPAGQPPAAPTIPGQPPATPGAPPVAPGQPAAAAQAAAVQPAPQAVASGPIRANYAEASKDWVAAGKRGDVIREGGGFRFAAEGSQELASWEGRIQQRISQQPPGATQVNLATPAQQMGIDPAAGPLSAAAAVAVNGRGMSVLGQQITPVTPIVDREGIATARRLTDNTPIDVEARVISQPQGVQNEEAQQTEQAQPAPQPATGLLGLAGAADQALPAPQAAAPANAGSGSEVQAAQGEQQGALSGVEPQGQVQAVPPLTRARTIEPGPAVVLQNRDRSSASSIAQMNDIAASPDYLRTGPARVMDSGAPVVFGDTPPTALVGREEVVADGRGKRTNMQYMVLEADDLLASHSADGSRIAEYEQGAPGKMRAVAGNGRAAGITEAYRRGTAEQYRQDLAADAQSVGIDPQAVQAMRNPVLVRVMSGSDVTPDIGDRSNIAGTAQLSAVEMAATDARRIDVTTLEFDEFGQPTPEAMQQFTMQQPVGERARLMTKNGAPTAEGVRRIMNAAFKQAYDSNELIELYAEDLDPDAKTVLTGIAGAAGAMANLTDTGDLDIRGAVAEAAAMAVNARRKGITLADMLKNADLDTSGEAFVIARFFADNIRSAKKIADGLRNWANYAYEQAQIARENQTQDGLFGAAPVASRSDVFQRIEDGQVPKADAIQPKRQEPTPDGAQRAQDEPVAGQAGPAVGDAEAAAQAQGLSEAAPEQSAAAPAKAPKRNKPKTIEEADDAVNMIGAASEVFGGMREEAAQQAKKEKISAWASQFTAPSEMLAASDIGRYDGEKLSQVVDTGRITLDRANEMLDSAVSAGWLTKDQSDRMKRMIAPAAVPAKLSTKPGSGAERIRAANRKPEKVAQPKAGTAGVPLESDGALPTSWVIRNKETGETVMETSDRAKVEALNTVKYEAVPIKKHLAGVNSKPAAPTPQPEARPVAPEQLDRFEAGKALTKEQRKQVLGTLVDVYKTKKAQREVKGVGRDGNERSGYVYSPELFEKSDITGAMVRYFVTLPDGRIAHPTELFPNYTQSDIDAEMSARESRKRDRKSDVDRMTVPAQVFSTQQEAKEWWDAASAKSPRSASGLPSVFPSAERKMLTNGQKFIMVPQTASGEMMEAFADAGWAAATPAPQAGPAKDQEKAKWIKATVDKSRLNGSAGVQIAATANGGITFIGDPRSNKDGQALLANYEQALKAGATQQEIAAALAADKKQAAAPKSQPGSAKKFARSDVSDAYKSGEAVIRGKTVNALTDGRHKGRIKAGLVKAGISEKDASAIMELATTIKVNGMASTGGMTFLSARHVLDAAEQLGFIDPPPKPSPAAKPIPAQPEAAKPKIEAWQTELPAKGLPVLAGDEKVDAGSRVLQRIAKDAVDAITQNQKINGGGLYAYVLPAANGNHGAVRLVPDDQTPPAPWKLMFPEVLRHGFLTKDQIAARLADALRREPVLGDAKAQPKKAESAQPSPEPILTAPTRADIEAQQERTEAATKAEKAQQRAADEAARRERERKDIANASSAAADTFELGGDPMANLTGQQDVFGAAPGGTPLSFSRTQSAAPFYSALAREIEALPTKAAPVIGWQAALQGLVKNGKVKADELEWTGVTEWLKLQTGKVTKEQITEYLKANGVQVEEVVLGGSDAASGYEIQRNGPEDYDVVDADGSVVESGFMARSSAQEFIDSQSTGQTKYSEYTLPGGTNYREVLLTLPVKKAKVEDLQYKTGADVLAKRDLFTAGGWSSESVDIAAALVDETGSVDAAARKQDALLARGYGYRNPDREAMQILRAILSGYNKKVSDATVEDAKKQYKSSHWDAPNVIAHLRLNDRIDVDGKRVLFVEEAQSDWGQDGKKKGVAVKTMTAQQRAEKLADAKRLTTKIRARSNADRAAGLEQITDETLAMNRADSIRVGEIMRELEDDKAAALANTGRIPLAPFIDKTDKWLALSLKRIIKMAVDGGYDRVAFVSGEQSADRYDLSKRVTNIMYRKTGDDAYYISVGGPEGGIHTGTHSAAELEDYVGKELAERIASRSTSQMQTLTGLDLKVGGEGMKSFYDKIVPAAAKDVLRKMGGGQMKTVEISPDNQAREPVKQYEGPNRTIVQVRELNEVARRGGRDIFYNPVTGRTESDAINRAVNLTALGKLMRNMEQGQSFAEAMLDPEYAYPAFAQLLGGKYTEAPAKGAETLKQIGFDVTDAMREKAAGGLPLFARNKEAPRTPVSAIRAAITRAYGNLLDKLEAKGLVTIYQTEAEAIDAAARARAEQTGEDLETVKQQMMGSVQMQQAMPDTIMVDGVERPTANSKGQPIHPTEAGVRNFWRWFGDSKVVDSQGRPLVVYHGTSASEDGDAFTTFNTYASNYGLMGMGGYFTDDPAVASSYTTKGKGTTPTVYKVFSSIKNPLDMDAKADAAAWERQFPGVRDYHEGGETNESWYRAAEEALMDEGVPKWEGAEIMQDGIRAMGFDGITHIGGGRVKADGVKHRVYITFDPEQSKSATGNTGAFNPADMDIRRSATNKIEGFFDKQTNRAFLVADNLTTKTAPATLMHEVGIHMAADESLEPLFKRAGSLLKTGLNNDFIKRVNRRMQRAGETSDEEAAAYIVTEYEIDRTSAPVTVMKWLADLKAAIKAWLYRKGIFIKAEDLTVADIAAVARANARGFARGGPEGGQGRGRGESASGVRLQRNDSMPADDFITIDGKKRPTTNSKGQKLAADANGVRNFWAWFGDSRVVDAEGRPLTVFHGTGADITEFQVSARGEFGGGIYLTPDTTGASDYAIYRGAGPANVLPVYVSIKKPAGSAEASQIASWKGEENAQAELIRRGYDGVIDLRSGQIVAFTPTQIKSATGNTGAFSPTNPDIRFSRAGNGGAVQDAVDRIKAFDVRDKPAGMLAHYRGMGMQALGRRQLVDLYSDYLPQLETYNDLVQLMDAEKNENGAQADKLATEWGKLDKETGKEGEERKLAELMHDATLAQIDPQKDYVDGENKARWTHLKAKFDALDPKSQALYVQARDMYADHYAAVRKAIKERIERSDMGDSQKQAMIARMDQDFFKKTKGVYFPLARFGNYVVVVKDANGEVVSVSRAETVNEANATRKELMDAFPRDRGYNVGKVLKDAEFNPGRDAVGKGFMADLFNVLDKSGVDEALRDSVSQLYLSSLPDLSWAKHGIHRKGTPGFSQDARRAFAQNMFHGARYLAKLRYSDRLQLSLEEMQDHIKAYEAVDEYDSVKAQQVLDEMVKRHENLMNPRAHPLSTALTSIGFVFFLGVSPAAAMVNLSQTALVAYPIMGAKWGFQKASAALLKASAEVVQAKNNIGSILTGDELAAYTRAVNDGTIDITMAHDLAGIAQGEDAKVVWAMRPAMRVASFLFHHAERFNRQATFIAAYRLAKESGPEKTEIQLYEEARKATYDGHFDYSASNRPRIMQGNVAKVILLFKQYGQNMVYTLMRQAALSLQKLPSAERTEARKQLGGILALHAAAAGVLGLPLVGMLLGAASMLGSDDDEPWDAEVAMKNAMADALGPKAAEVISHGVSRLTPWDISSRVALDRLILPDVQEGLEGQKWAEKLMVAAAGPVGGIFTGTAKGLQSMTEGEYQRGLEEMLPVALRNLVKSYRFHDEGAQDKTGVVIKDEVSLSGVLGQASGFAPSEVAGAMEGRRAIYKADRKLTERRSVIMKTYATARMTGDAEGVQDALAMVRAFNEKNPTRRITMPNLMQSVRARQRRIDEATQGIYLPKNRQDVLAAGRFSLDE